MTQQQKCKITLPSVLYFAKDIAQWGTAMAALPGELVHTVHKTGELSVHTKQAVMAAKFIFLSQIR